MQGPRPLSVGSPAGLRAQAPEPEGSEQAVAQAPMTLARLPEELLTDILQFCDGPTLDTVLSVSQGFKYPVRKAHEQLVFEMAKRPGRITQERLPTRLELVAMGITNPHFCNILNTMRTATMAQASAPGTLMRNMQSHSALQQAQHVAGEPALLVPRITETTTDIGECNAQQQSHGFAIRTFQNVPGQRYEGAFVNGSQHGMGYEYLSDGIRYEGNFENGRMHGRGTQTWPDGGRYEGARPPHATCTDGRYDGMAIEGKLQGKDALFFSDGTRS